MKIRLYAPRLICNDVFLHLPKGLRRSVPAFVWTRFHFENDLWGAANYNGDDVLAVSYHQDGPIIPIRATVDRQEVIKIPTSFLKAYDR